MTTGLLLVATGLLAVLAGAMLAERRRRLDAPRFTLRIAAVGVVNPGEVLRLTTTSGPPALRLVLWVEDGQIIHLRDLTRFERWAQNRWRRRWST